MIPEGWKQTELGALADFASGGTPSKQNEAFWGGFFPWVSAKDLKKHVINNAELCLTEEGRKVAKTAPIGSVLVLVRGMTLLKDVPIGYVAEPVAFNQDIKALVAKSYVAPKFLAYLLVSLRRPLMTLVNTANHGTGRLDTDLLKSFPVVLPSFVEQCRIAKTLETWDRAIETVEALTANARARKHALMQQLLPQGATPPKKRLPGFSGEWKEIRLGNAFTERVERGEGGLALLSVTQASGVIPQEEAGRRNISSNDQSNYKTVRSGDIAYNTMRMWQGASALSNLTGKVSPAYTVVTPRKGHDAAFYAYFFKQSKAIHVFERHSQGLVSDTWSLKFPLFAEIRICVPKFDEQKAIASAFKSADDLMFSYKTQLAALRREKAALMQQLLTGKRRVKFDNKEVAA